MEPSEEIRRVVHRWLTACAEGDADVAAARVSDHPGGLGIGTDPEEWWTAEVSRLLRQQVAESGGYPMSWDEIAAWEEGTVGWAATRLSYTSGEETFPLRVTIVLHLERGEWKIVQTHWSVAIPNEAIGLELTTTLDQLERTVQRERPDLTGALAADGTVTIVFTDIVDSTVLTARLGDHAWLELVRRHNDVIRTVTTEHGGTVVETQGDGSMLAFSSARRAVACSKAIQQRIDDAFAGSAPPIRVRIGVHTGDAIHESDHFFGTTVNYAARVAGHALGGEVLVSNLVHELVTGSGVAFSESREVELKGLDGSHRLFALTLG